MSVSYEPFVSTLETGAVIMQVDYDPSDPPPISKSAMLNSLGASRSSVWMKANMPLSRKELSYDDHLFVRHAVRGGFSENLKLYDVGTVFVTVTDNDSAATTKSYGEVWVNYDITLMVPAFHGQTPNVAESALVTADYSHLLGEIKSSDPSKMASGSAINFVTADNGAGETAITFKEPFTGIVYLEQSGYASDDMTHLELEPQPEPTGGWISNLVSLGGSIIDYVLSDNKWKYMFEVVAEAGQSLVLAAEAIGAGDITTWIGNAATLMTPYAEELMLLTLPLGAMTDQQVRQRVQSGWIHRELSPSEVVPRSEWLRRQVGGGSPRLGNVRTDTAETKVV